MKQIVITLLATSALLLGLTGCNREKEIDIEELEQSLVGVWWDQYEYSDITETGVAFDKVLLAVVADVNHTGCIYLGSLAPTEAAAMATI